LRRFPAQEQLKQMDMPIRPAKVTLAATALALASIALSGCSAHRSVMKIAPELSSLTPTDVTGRNPNSWSRDFRFATWRVTTDKMPIIRGSEHRGGASPPLPRNTQLSHEYDQAWSQFEVTSTAVPSPTTANCLAQGMFTSLIKENGRVTDTTEVTLPGYPRVNCDFSGTQHGTLAMQADFPSQRDAGTAEINGHLWRIRSVNTFATQSSNFPFARLGFEIVLEDRVVGAVETWNFGKLWMDPNLAPQLQEEVSLIAATLLQYTPLLDTQGA
jgi:hypothetical protein